MLDVARVGIRFAHALAAVAWVGGSLFYVLALTPALDRIGRTRERNELVAAVGREFRPLVRIAIVVFLFTGALLTFDRLSQPRVPVLYVAILALKVALSLWMFWLARRLESGEVGSTGTAPASSVEPPPIRRRRVRPQALVLALGLAVYLLAITLKVVFEAALAGP